MGQFQTFSTSTADECPHAALRPGLSLVIPVFNEEAVLDELCKRLATCLGCLDVSWEVIFVDDGSRDATQPRLRTLSRCDTRYKLVVLSRNFGHQAAITAGLDYARGEAVVTMDADLQDPPELIQQMLQLHREGHDVVFAVRSSRKGEGLFKRATAALFYRLFRRLVRVDVPLDTGDFRLMSRDVVLTLRALRETHRFVRAMVAWVGFKQTAITYERDARFAGKTHYPFRRMLRFALDGVTSFSVTPLRVAFYVGAAAGVGGVIVAVWATYVKLFNAMAVPGWATIVIVVSLASSAHLLMTGLLGEYVGRIYEEVKRRPLYLVQHETNTSPDTYQSPP